MQGCHAGEAGRGLRQKGFTGNGAVSRRGKSPLFILSVIIMNKAICLIQIKENGLRRV